MTIGVWVLGDQLWTEQAALASCPQPQLTPVILIESLNYSQQRPYHRQKLVLVWSAMRHFAATLSSLGWSVTYRQAEDFQQPLQAWLKDYHITELRIMVPNDRPFQELVSQLALPCQINWLPNNHFFWSPAEFASWATPRKRLLLEDFYRAGRKRWQVLMAGEKPVGGQWNFDSLNRQPPPKSLQPPPPLRFPPDAITKQVIREVKALSIPLSGQVEPFDWGVTRDDAIAALDHFLQFCLPNFGAYQDAMVIGEDTLWHSLLSPYLNLGLLTPQEVIRKVEQAWQEQDLPLNSVEGFIRQILGWREYLQGLYHFLPADYGQNNWFNHDYPLPAFYWDASKTNLNCLHQVLSQVEKTGYAHHIQRLMILSNFALIVGVSPQELETWFHAVFIDAYDWVMQTNVIGMGQFADGGILASKPYAASANYIHRMSNYCQGCVYNYRQRTGQDACPFNFFYWDFLDRHRPQLQSLGRMNLSLANLNKIAPSELEEMRRLAQNWRQNC